MVSLRYLVVLVLHQQRQRMRLQERIGLSNAGVVSVSDSWGLPPSRDAWIKNVCKPSKGCVLLSGAEGEGGGMDVPLFPDAEGAAASRLRG